MKKNNNNNNNFVPVPDNNSGNISPTSTFKSMSKNKR